MKDRWFNQDEIDRFTRFAKHCIHPKGQFAGDSFHILPFQQSYIDEVYGWYLGDKREARQAFFSCARGNGKSSFASLIAAFELFCNDEANPYCLIASATLESATIIFNDVQEFILASPKLASKVKIVESDQYIEYRRKNGNKSVIKCVAADRRNAHGRDCTCLILDEVHLLERKHADFISALKYSASKNRRNPLMLYFSTAGILQEGPAWDLYQHAKAIKEGKVKDPSFKVFLWESTPEMPLDDEATWHAANPAMEFGIVDKEVFGQQLEEAKLNSTELAKFTYQKLNRWVQTAGSYLDPTMWDACKRTYPNLNGLPIVLGFDPSSTGVDLACLVGLIEVDGIYYAKLWAFTTEYGLHAHDKNNLLNYRGWQEEGLLTIHDGNCIDFANIRNVIHEINKVNPIKTIVVEKWQETEFVQTLMQHYKVLEQPPQPAYYHTPTQKLARMVGNRSLAHDGNSLLRTAAVCLEVKETKGLLMPFKRNKHGSTKQDAAMALILAINALDNVESKQPKHSIYNDRGVIYV